MRKIAIVIITVLFVLFLFLLTVTFYSLNPLTIKVSASEYLSYFHIFKGFHTPLVVDLLVALWVVGLGYLIGRKLLGSRFEGILEEAEKRVFAIALGLFVIGMGTLGLGLAGLIYRWLFFAIFALLSILLIPYRDISHQKGNPFRAMREWFSSLCLPEKLMVAFMIAVVCAGFFNALTPPTQSDGIRYHLTGPQEYIKAHRIQYIPLNAFTNFPFLVEMLYLDGLLLGGDSCPKLIHFCMLFIIIAALRNFWKYRIEPLLNANHPETTTPSFLQTLLVFSFVTTPCIVILASWSFIEMGIVLYLFLSFYLFFVWVEKRRDRLLPLIGIFLGAALGTKYTLLAHAWFLSLLVFVFSLKDSTENSARCLPRRAITAFKKTLIVGGIALALASPWFIKNYVATGNPVYPLFYNVLGGKEWSQANADLYMSKIAGKGFGTSLNAFMMLPYRTAFEWQKFGAFNIGILFLFFTCLYVAHFVRTIFSKSPHRRISLLLYLLLFFHILLWFFSYQSNRFLIPIIPLALIIMGIILHEIRSEARLLYRLLAVAVMVIGIYNGLWVMRFLLIDSHPVPFVLGFETKDEYLNRNLDYIRMFQDLNVTVGKDEKTLFIGEYRGFYCEAQYLASDWYDTPYILHFIRRTKSTADLMSKLAEENVRYVFLNNRLIKAYLPFFRMRFTDEEWERFGDFLTSERLKKTSNENEMIILRIVD